MFKECVSLILGIITCITSILMYIANYKSAKAMKEQVKEMKRQFDELNRPYINVEFNSIKHGVAVLYFINNGTRIANDVEIHFSQVFLDTLEPDIMNYLNKDQNKSCIIGVNQSYVIFLGSYQYLSDCCSEPICGNIRYNSNGKEYEDTFSIDLDKYKTICSTSTEFEDFTRLIEEQNQILKNLK